MKERKDLLIEIGTEELPPKALGTLASAFASEIHAGLAKNNLKHNVHRWYATPRRITVIVEKLVCKQDDQEVVRRGPSLNTAYDNDGKPSKALSGFLKSCGIEEADLEELKTDKGSWLAFRKMEKGRAASELIPEIILAAISKLPIPKRMRWSNFDAEFVRPVHWSIVLLGRDVVACDILGTRSGNDSFGHRFHHPGPLRITSASTYLKKLKSKAYVLADFDERRDKIKSLVISEAQNLNGRAVINEDLLREVTALVEWPVASSGSFDEKYLSLPREVLIATMQDHQKYFPVHDNTGNNLLNHFIAIANIESKSPLQIKKGNEKVIRPRLEDADFFWQRDRSQAFSSFEKYLPDVIFQKQLGTLGDKTKRVIKICDFIASQVNADKELVKRAAQLAKCDLFTDMVGEFPELQGIMGRYYAEMDGEHHDVCQAMDEQYMPRHAGDNLPVTSAGQILSIADKLDTLTGIFAIGQKPSGEKDPFGLRRAALGCLRIMVERELQLDLEACINCAAESYKKEINTSIITGELFDYMMERLRRYYLDAGIPAEIFDSVLTRRPTTPLDFHHRIEAVVEFSKLPESKDLAAANKRIGNILKQSKFKDNAKIDKQLLIEDAEINLARALDNVNESIMPMLAENNYTDALLSLANLRDEIDTFFDQVMVMCDDQSLKNNRLSLLKRLSELFLCIADISVLHT